ncbi:MAG: Holliday junction resolvase RuvX [Acidiferrobacteraceae bacterium]|nr:Holliday junction resolvase RuvX [Acidiferrobacteraceae bacterium]|tara:strand:+ start:379 stop:825 length:447 start_codon:yes stop_codon:yes gene_type:complete
MNEILLGFDYGSQKIGVAVGQVGTGSTQGIATIKNNSSSGPWTKIQNLINDWKPAYLIVGIPLTSSGDESQFAKDIRKFAEQLQYRFNLPVNFIDETLTTDLADAIIRETTKPGKRITKRRQSLRDQIAAEFILQTYINEFNNIAKSR